jgi:hypothetical protein
MPTRPQKITLAEMRASGVHGLLIYCSDYHCSHWTAMSDDSKLPPIKWAGGCICIGWVIFQDEVVQKSPRLATARSINAREDSIATTARQR